VSQLLAIGLGGALGAIARYGMGQLALLLLPRAFPFGTLLINVCGSVLIGVVYAWTLRRGGPGILYSAVAIGFLGAFTTFSTFALETVQLAARGQPWPALGYTMLSVGLCVGGAWLGMQFGQR
jgi:CrcB protein